MRNLKRLLFCAKMSMWQPWPYIAQAKDSPLSWWFYNRLLDDPESMLFKRNRLGNIWYDTWKKAGGKINPV